MVNMQIPYPIAIVLSLVFGGLVGAWQGFWVAYVRIPSFIVTLAGMLLFRGLTMVVLNGQSISPFPKGFQRISSGFIPDWFGGSDLHMLTIVIGLLLTLVLVFTEWRNRLTQQRYQFSVISAPLFALKLVGIVPLLTCSRMFWQHMKVFRIFSSFCLSLLLFIPLL